MRLELREEVVVPIIHLNGDRAETLLENLYNAVDAVHATGDALAKCCPNGRNFYPVDGLMPKAVEQHEERMLLLKHLAVSLTKEIEGIQDQSRK